MPSDSLYVTEEQGIVKVPHERWGKAQEAERSLWMEEGLWWNSDRNEEHMLHFDGYAALKEKQYSSSIELGCGPFTNLRIIARFCKISECSLLDPLIESYLEHPGCTYSRRIINIAPFDHMTRFLTLIRKLRKSSPFVANLLLSAHRALRPGEKIPIKAFFPLPIEEMPDDSKHDLIIMINVIEHCFDINKIFDKILSIAKANATFVFHDHYYTHNDIVDRVQRYFDPYHPLRVDRSVIDMFLEKNFTTVFRKDVLAEKGQADDSAHDSVYFIGLRK